MTQNYTTKQLESVVGSIMDLGEAIITCGGEISRAEDTLRRLGAAYGAVRVDVFAINSCIMSTMEFSDGSEFSLTRRILTSESTDLKKLEELNSLSRCLTLSPDSPETLSKEVRRIVKKPSSVIKTLLGSLLGAAAFTMFFGGTVWDALAASFFGAMVWLAARYAAPVSPNRVFYNFVSSFAVGTLIGLFCRVSPVFHRDMISIGVIMLMIPGVALTYSVRNVLVGDTVSGSTKAIEAIIWAASLAAGFSLALAVVR